MTFDSDATSSAQSDTAPLSPRFAPLFDRVIVLTGPTASGKTQLALAVAEAVPPEHAVEIISLDSMAVYRGMNIGTAKPSADQRQRVAHHLVDCVDPEREFSIAEYLSHAHELVKDIRRRSKWPMFVGGTPLYLKAILRGFDPGPPADETFREAVMRDVERFGIEALRQRLRQVDPLSAARIDPGDARRMIRALEFAKHTGMPISHRQDQFELERSPDEGLAFTLQTPRAILHERIERRVAEMFQQGLIDEVRNLVDSPGGLSKTARQGVGYREVMEFLEIAEPTEQDENRAMQQVLFHTRRLARRQETWFRSFGEIRSLATHRNADETPIARPDEELVDEMVRVITNRQL